MTSPPRTAVAAAGYDVAFAVAREHGRFAVDRVFVQSTDSLLAFRLKLSGGYRLVSRVGGRAWKLRHLVRAQVARVRPAGDRSPRGGNGGRCSSISESADAIGPCPAASSTWVGCRWSTQRHLLRTSGTRVRDGGRRRPPVDRRRRLPALLAFLRLSRCC